MVSYLKEEQPSPESTFFPARNLQYRKKPSIGFHKNSSIGFYKNPCIGNANKGIIKHNIKLLHARIQRGELSFQTQH